MAPTEAIAAIDRGPAIIGSNEARGSGVSWPAIWAGAVAATATSLILLLLGSGIGLASISPWPSAGASATAFGVGAAIWLIVVQWVSSGLGGYLAGRLRTKWVGVHTDEVFFRDTAHGLVTWAVATIFAVGLIVASSVTAVRTGTEAMATAVSGAAQGVAAAADAGGAVDPMAYLNDVLFRSPNATPDQNATAGEDVRGETMRILAQGVAADEFPADDRTYLAQLVAAQTGLTPAEAEARVDQVIADAQAAKTDAIEIADAARETASMIAFYGFLSLLIGAFIAAVAAAIGGRQRDDFETVVVSR